MRSMDVGRYTCNSKDFCQNFIYPSCLYKPCVNSLISSISILLKSIKEDIQWSRNLVDNYRHKRLEQL